MYAVEVADRHRCARRDGTILLNREQVRRYDGCWHCLIVTCAVNGITCAALVAVAGDLGDTVLSESALTLPPVSQTSAGPYLVVGAVAAFRKRLAASTDVDIERG